MKAQLYLFRFSNYCEKVEWCADYKNAAVEKKYLLPGLHAKEMRKTSGQTSVPVLTQNSDIVIGSTSIAQFMEKEFDGPALLPEEPEFRSAILDLTERIDLVGGLIRANLFQYLLSTPIKSAQLFTKTSRSFYSILLFAGAKKLRQMLDEDGLSVQQRNEKIVETLDLLDSRRKNQDFLFQSFGFADITAAALLFPCFFPDEISHPYFRGFDRDLDQWFSLWREHPTIHWAREIYSAYRQPHR